MQEFCYKIIKKICIILVNILILRYYGMGKNHNQTKLLKKGKSLMTITVPHSDNSEVEYLKSTVRGLQNKIKLLSAEFEIKLDILERQNKYKDKRIKSLYAELDAKVAALNNHSVRGDGRDKVWAKMAELDDIINNEQKLHAFTLVSKKAFDHMLVRVQTWLETNRNTKLYYDNSLRASDPGNRSKLKPVHALLLYLYDKRSKDPEVVVGGWFDLDRTNVVRQCDFMEHVLSIVLPTISNVKRFLCQIASNEEFYEFVRTIMVDGTRIPAPKSNDKDNPETSGYSGKTKNSGFNTVAACTQDGILVSVSKTCPGNRHDYAILKENLINLGLYDMEGGPDADAELMRKIKLYMDRGFLGVEKDYPDVAACIPHRGKDKKSSKEIKAAYKTKDDKTIADALGLTLQQYKDNKEISSIRSLIERILASIKKHGALAGPHMGTASELNRTFDVIGGIHNLEIMLKNPDKYGPILDDIDQRIGFG